MIYPLDQQIENLFYTFVDEETGELKCTEEEMQEAVAQLEMDFDKKIVALRNSFLETELNAKRVAAEAKTLRDEAANVQRRATALQNRADRIKRFVAYLLQGEKFDKDGAKITYRKSEECVIEDSYQFEAWAMESAPDLLNITPKKADIKAAIKNGHLIEFAHIEERSNIQIK